MTDILGASANVLGKAGFATRRASIGDRELLVFEDCSVPGFLYSYTDPTDLIQSWEKDVDRAIAAHQFGLRRAGQKAWNVYVVLLAASKANHGQSAALTAIEEDLRGTRKIVSAGVADLADLRAALLPLLPLQSAPRLEAVDMVAEIRERTTELPSRAVDAFLSTADDSVVIQVLEEAP
jgi:hypothetical protein